MKLAIALAFASLIALQSANAQTATTPKKSIDVGTCGEMWKAHKAAPGYADPGKGNRMAAWIEFRKAKCSKTREG